MLSTAPAAFKYNEVTFKEFNDLGSLEKVLFSEFVLSAYSQPDSQRLEWAPDNGDQIIQSFNNKFVDDARWVIYSGINIVGFWVLNDHSGDCFIDFYVAPQFESGNVDVVLLEVASRIAKSSEMKLFININHFSLNRLNHVGNVLDFGDNDDLSKVDCDEIIPIDFNEHYDKLVNQVKQFYVN